MKNITLLINFFIVINATYCQESIKELFKKSWDTNDTNERRMLREDIIKKSPDSEYGLFCKAWIFSLKDDYDASIDFYTRAIELEEDFWQAYFNRGVIYAKILKDYSNAIIDFNRVVELKNDFWQVYLWRGSAYTKFLKNYSKALLDYNKAIALNPKYAGLYFNRGIVYFELKEYFKALSDYNKVIQIDSNFVAAYNNRGSVYFYLGDSVKACENWYKAKILGSTSAKNNIQSKCNKTITPPLYTNWVMQKTGIDEGINSIYFIDYNIGWAVSDKGSILNSTNGGDTWTVQARIKYPIGSGISSEELNTIYFKDKLNGWICGNTCLLNTTNGGLNWNLYSIPNASISSISFLNDKTGWAVGPMDRMLYTNNGGINWTEYTSPVPAGLFSAYFINSRKGWMVGGNNTILSTRDGGHNWNIDRIESIGDDLSSICFINENTGWIAGHSGTILKTTDGGDNWEDFSSIAKIYPDVFEIKFLNEYTGWVIGSNVYKTIDGGYNWVSQEFNNIRIATSTGICFYSSFFLNEFTGWVVGQKDFILKTTNGGDNSEDYRSESEKSEHNSIIPEKDDKIYTTVTIGTQEWMSENLNISHYRNGDIIPQVQDIKELRNLKSGAWCYYDNESENGKIYGKLYNWYAVNDSRGLAPNGWHIPSYEEWEVISDYLGGVYKAGDKLKSIIFCNHPNTGTANISGFGGLPGGIRNEDGLFINIGERGYFWSKEHFSNLAWIRDICCFNSLFGRYTMNKTFFLSVRCIKD